MVLPTLHIETYECVYKNTLENLEKLQNNQIHIKASLYTRHTQKYIIPHNNRSQKRWEKKIKSH